MPVDTLAEGLMRFVGEVVLELLIKGPGYFFVKRLGRSGAERPDANSFSVVFAGALFWVVVGVSVYFIYQAVMGGEA